jgi:hypothetical protein
VAPSASSVSPIPAARSETTWFWLRKEKQRVKQDRAAAPVLCSKPVSESNRSGEAASSRSSSCQSRRRRRGPPDRTRGYGHCCRCHASTAARLLYLTRSHLTRGEERTQPSRARVCTSSWTSVSVSTHTNEAKKNIARARVRQLDKALLPREPVACEKALHVANVRSCLRLEFGDPC